MIAGPHTHLRSRLAWAAVAAGVFGALLHVAQVAWLRAEGGDPSVRKAALAMVTPLAAAAVGLGLARGDRRIAFAGTTALALLALGDLWYAWTFVRGVIGLDAPDARASFALAHVQAVVQVGAMVVAALWLDRPTRGRAIALAVLLLEMAAASLVSPWVGTPHSEMLTPLVLVLKPLATGGAFACAAGALVAADRRAS